jgi:hypothetical protein
MAFAEVYAIYNPIKSQIFSVELAHLLARLEGLAGVRELHPQSAPVYPVTRRRIIETIRVSAYLLAMCLIMLVAAMALLGCTPSVPVQLPQV